MSCNGHAWKENHGGVRGLSSIVERIRARVGEVVNLCACGRTMSRVTIGSSKVHNAL